MTKKGINKDIYLFNTFPLKVILILGNNKLSENKEKTERRDESEFFYVYIVERKSRYVTLQW